MTEAKTTFITYLEQLGIGEIKPVIRQFEHYQQLLVRINESINLISRKMPADAYWTQHFLDSITIMECLDLSGAKVLDFGSGGGLPGIPLKLCVPSVDMTLLDSIGKKVRALQEMITELKLSETTAVCNRLEDYAALARRPSYDLILCRAVAMEERYVYPLRKLLKPRGKVIFYKAQNTEDIRDYSPELLHERQDDVLGTRRIFAVARDALKD